MANNTTNTDASQFEEEQVKDLVNDSLNLA